MRHGPTGSHRINITRLGQFLNRGLGRTSAACAMAAWRSPSHANTGLLALQSRRILPVSTGRQDHAPRNLHQRTVGRNGHGSEVAELPKARRRAGGRVPARTSGCLNPLCWPRRATAECLPTGLTSPPSRTAGRRIGCPKIVLEASEVAPPPPGLGHAVHGHHLGQHHVSGSGRRASSGMLGSRSGGLGTASNSSTGA